MVWQMNRLMVHDELYFEVLTAWYLNKKRRFYLLHTVYIILGYILCVVLWNISTPREILLCAFCRKSIQYREPKSQPFSRARWDLISEKHCRSSFLILCELCLEGRMLVHLKYIFANQESRSFFAKEAKYLLVLCKTSQGTLSSPLICITNTNMAAAQAQKKH